MIPCQISATLLLLPGICAAADEPAGSYIPGAHRHYTHESGEVPADTASPITQNGLETTRHLTHRR